MPVFPGVVELCLHTLTHLHGVHEGHVYNLRAISFVLNLGTVRASAIDPGDPVNMDTKLDAK